MTVSRSVVAVAVVVATAASGAVASAKTVRYNNIVSPTKNISCYAVRDSSRIECLAPYLPRPSVGEGDPYFTVGPRGRAKLSSRGDFPGFSSPRRTLHYGDLWKRTGLACSMKKSGLTCRNRDNHGFHIAKGNSYRF